METFDGQERIVTIKTVGYTGWKIVGVTPMQDAVSDSYAIRTFAVFIILFTIFLMIFVNLFISSRIANPIKRLERSVKGLEGGNWDTEIAVGGSYEIAHLGKTIRTMVAQMRRLMDDIVAEQESKRKSEFDALQSQINPHFLYNTLDTIQWKALEYQAMDIAEMIQMLSQLFRLSLNNGKEMVSVEEELTHVQNYLAIQKIRYGDAVSYTLDAAPAVAQYRIPKLILQPLVENAIYHGIKPAGRPGQIRIRLWEEEAFLYLQAADNGAGMTAQAVTDIRRNLELSLETDHYGLYNVNERLRLCYGSAYRLRLESRPGEGTCVTLRLPLAVPPTGVPLCPENTDRSQEAPGGHTITP